MLGHLPYKTALVTGASRGIGFEIARRLCEAGLRIHGVARNAEQLAEAASQIDMTPHAIDICDTAALEDVVPKLEIDVLVNNAGLVSAVRPLTELSADEVDDMIDVNLRAPLQLMRMVLPGMVERGYGHVINMTSTAAHHILPGTTPYGAAKAGLAHAGAITRYDLAGSGVRLSELAPARVATGIYDQAFGGDRARLTATLFEGYRTLQPEDVARAVLNIVMLPDHVDVPYLELSSTDQATGGQVFAKRGVGTGAGS